ncbi:hypothetical protein [Nocardiopsis lambiniae]|uniref:Uncharacterized protein n=1 Tax=Nocardiopsis lambiniae TaxID=3075539 RepID=A0ABU2M9H9_9ACTN|nr:hypothetical protein [Nocardiopsis sp. DSM 44743]MDT0329324.1 hypothetical protein [Nocardiopsis sp. DSM 44743]
MRQHEALDALEQAGTLGARMRGQGGWYGIFGAGYAAMSCGLILAIGFAPSLSFMMWATAVCLLLIAVLITYALTRPVQPRSMGRLHLGMMGAWTVVYSVTVVVGSTWLPDVAAWWITGAVLSAVPPLVAGYVALRQSRNPR